MFLNTIRSKGFKLAKTNIHMNFNISKFGKVNAKYFGGHHEVTGEVDLKKMHVPVEKNNSRYISLTGTYTQNDNISGTIEGTTKARGAITPIYIPLVTRSRVYFKDFANVSYEENPYFHPEPYGYYITDDVSLIYS